MDVRKELFSIVENAIQIHAQEQRITLESVEVVGKLEVRNAAVNMGMSSERFARYVGLTPNQYWKRAQAARVMRFFPKAKEMVLVGETQISHLSMIAARITQANSEVLLDGIKNKSRRQVEGLLSRITFDGNMLANRDPEIELRIKLRESDFALLDRAREILSHGGQAPSAPEILVKALNDLLEKRDPLRKAERAAARAEKKNSPSAGKEASPHKPVVEQHMLKQLPRHDTPPLPSAGKEPRRRAIPQAIKHQVWLRDQGQCTWTFPDGGRCPERGMLGLDHREMWCRGGEHSVENLTLKCRRHNQFAAEQILGSYFMEAKRGVG
ncbi:MAG: HNH endonuclease [Oligoflexales bacterium]